jgi:hypothetical protein
VTTTSAANLAGAQWCGYPAHFIGARNCRYGLSTWLPNGFVVSTVGDYHPRGQDEMETIGAGEDAFFETFVFRAEHRPNDPNHPHGWEIVDFCEMDGNRWANAHQADAGHARYVVRYAERDAAVTVAA